MTARASHPLSTAYVWQLGDAQSTEINMIEKLIGYSDIVSNQRYLHFGEGEVPEEPNKNIRFDMSAPRE